MVPINFFGAHNPFAQIGYAQISKLAATVEGQEPSHCRLLLGHVIRWHGI